MTTEEKEKIQRERRKFTIRRRMAITAFAHMILIVFCIFMVPLIDAEAAKALSDFNSIIIAVIGADLSIIGAYIGSVTATDIKSISKH